MPTFYLFSQLQWNYRSKVKFFRRTRQRLDGSFWIVVDREFCKIEKLYKYKLFPA